MSDFLCVGSQYRPYQLNIKSIFDSALDSDVGNPIVYRAQRFSYSEFADRVRKLAGVLQQLDVQREQTVAFMDYDSNRYLEAYFAVPMYGAVLLTVNFRFSPAQLVHALNTAKAEVLFIHEDFLELYQAIASQLSTIKKLVWITESGKPVPEGFAGEFETLLAAAPEQFEFEDLPEDTRATTFYTTGTTGMPKGVYYTHRQLALHTMGQMGSMGTAPNGGNVTRTDVYMPLTPLFHVHAWGIPFTMTCLGAKQIYPGRYDPTEILRIIREEKVTFTHSVPTLLHMLLNHPDADRTDFNQLKITIGGSAISENLAEQAHARGISIRSGWGMSETGPLILNAQLRHPEADPRDQLHEVITTGYPAPFCQVRIVDADLKPLPKDGRHQGELVVRAPWLTPGYLADPDASEQLWHEGWLRTGDIAVIQPNGLVRLVDRIKDVIKTGGEWVSSIAVESVISTHPAVSEVAVIGRSDPKWGERPVAYVTLKDGVDADQKNIQDYVSEHIKSGELAPYSVPDQVFFVDSLPRTSVGKLNKRALKEMGN